MTTFFDLPNDILELIYKKKHQMEWREVHKTAGDERHLSFFTNHLVPGETYEIYRGKKLDVGRFSYHAEASDCIYLSTTKDHCIFLNPDGSKSMYTRASRFPLKFMSMTISRTQILKIWHEEHRPKCYKL